MQVNLNQFKQCKVLVVGDLMLDQYWYGKTGRISPEAPVPVVAVNKEEYRLGGAANTALNTASLGAQTTVIGVTGQDAQATILKQQFEAAGIAANLVEEPDFKTITKLRVISQNQQLIRADFEEAINTRFAENVVSKAQQSAREAHILLLSDYGKGSLAECGKLIEIAREHNIPVLVDPKGSDFSKYQGATLLTPNLSEFEAVVGPCPSDEALTTAATRLIDEIQLQALLITRSEKGMTLVQKGGQSHHFPTRAKEVYDVTGAGDTVISTLTVALGSGMDMETSTALANIAAGIVVGKLGTAAITAPDLKQAIDQQQSLEVGQMNREQLLASVELSRQQGDKIVFTNGCFDILHAGHVSYLEEARKLGDRLIVAVNSDASVKRLKGEGRPINNESRRMTVLAALKAVDWVICFEEDTPESLIEALKPDLLVKGGDYNLSGVVGADIVRQYGGEVRVIPVTEECSTTATINHIKKS